MGRKTSYSFKGTHVISANISSQDTRQRVSYFGTIFFMRCTKPDNTFSRILTTSVGDFWELLFPFVGRRCVKNPSHNTLWLKHWNCGNAEEERNGTGPLDRQPLPIKDTPLTLHFSTSMSLSVWTDSCAFSPKFSPIFFASCIIYFLF